MSKKVSVDPKSTVTVTDYLTIERLVRERPSLSNLDKAVQLFPTCAIFWVTYLDFLIENPEKSIKIVDRAVQACCHIDLWKRYLNIAKQVWRMPDVFPLYERAVAAIGHDHASTEIWIEYQYVIRAVFNTQVLLQYNCLENPSQLPPAAVLVPLSPMVPSGLNEDLLDVEGLKLIQHRPTIGGIRDIFQAALSVPMDRIDSVWDEYQAFEQVVANAMIAIAQTAPSMGNQPQPALQAGVQATKMLSEYSSRWLQSKQGLKEVLRIYAPINPYFAPLPLDSSSAETLKPNIVAWRRVVEFEKQNPFKLNYKRFRARMLFVLDQALLSNVYVAEFWIEKFVYLLADEGRVAALAVIEHALRSYLVNDVLLRLVLAYMNEEAGDVPRAKQVYVDSLLHFSHTKRPVPSLLMHYIRFAARSLSAVHARTIFLDHVRDNSIHLDARVCRAFGNMELRMMRNPHAAEVVEKVVAIQFPHDAQATVGVKGGAVGVGNLVSPPVVVGGVLSLPIGELKSVFEVGPLTLAGGSKVSGGEIDITHDGGDVGKSFGGARRPDVSRMLSFKPGMDEEAAGVAGEGGKFDLKSNRVLAGWLELLPECNSLAIPETDALLKAVQQVDLPAIAIHGLRRIDQDPSVEQFRVKAREDASNHLKRLVAAEGEKADAENGVIIKSDLHLGEDEQRDFLSALASNIHRERVYYKRQKLILSA